MNNVLTIDEKIDTLNQKIQQLENQILSTKKVLTLDEFCSYTGFKKSYVYKLTSNRQVPYSSKNGKSLFFEKDLIDNWLLDNPIKTSSQLQKETGLRPVLRTKKRFS